MEKTFDKKIIYITGASAGIGYATAELCLKKGATVIITGRDKENLKNAEKQLLKISSDVIAHNVDVSNESQIINSLEDVYKSCGTIDGLVNNAPGAIVNVASVVGLKGVAYMSAYGAAKAGLINFSRASAVEAAPHVRVNCVIPGAVLTPATERAIPAKEMMDQTIKTIPLKRIAQPIELAHPIVFLLGSEASFITGASLVVDGGKTGDLNAGN